VQVAEFGTPQRAAAERSYLKSTLRHLGAPVPAVRRVVRNWVRRHPDVVHDDLFAITDELWAEPVHERRLAAVELLQAMPRRITADDLPWLDRRLRECHTWALVDPLAGLVVADLAAREPDAVMPVLDAWVVDDDFWIRRSAVLALRSALRRGDQMDRLLGYACTLLPDGEFFVRKAVGWVLREAAPHHPREVSTWLREHIDAISLITLREPLRKLADGDEIRALYDSRRKPAG
jgi:3-methyladenine DNA glycosylase AlkD